MYKGSINTICLRPIHRVPCWLFLSSKDQCDFIDLPMFSLDLQPKIVNFLWSISCSKNHPPFILLLFKLLPNLAVHQWVHLSVIHYCTFTIHPIMLQANPSGQPFHILLAKQVRGNWYHCKFSVFLLLSCYCKETYAMSWLNPIVRNLVLNGFPCI